MSDDQQRLHQHLVTAIHEGLRAPGTWSMSSSTPRTKRLATRPCTSALGGTRTRRGLLRASSFVASRKSSATPSLGSSRFPMRKPTTLTRPPAPARHAAKRRTSAAGRRCQCSAYCSRTTWLKGRADIRERLPVLESRGVGPMSRPATPRGIRAGTRGVAPHPTPLIAEVVGRDLA